VFRCLCQDPRQRHFNAQRILQHFNGPSGNLTECAHLKLQRISFPNLLVDRDDLSQLTFGANKALFETADSLDLSETMADDDCNGFAHGRYLRIVDVYARHGCVRLLHWVARGANPYKPHIGSPRVGFPTGRC
jgi:hypothetical protein